MQSAAQDCDEQVPAPIRRYGMSVATGWAMATLRWRASVALINCASGSCHARALRLLGALSQPLIRYEPLPYPPILA
eukprot:6197737-Pleurochrysis_carterae.AAC.3